MNKVNNHKVNNQRKHSFLLTFFNDIKEYQTKEINGYVLVKQYNGTTKRWEVAIYTKESFRKKLF